MRKVIILVLLLFVFISGKITALENVNASLIEKLTILESAEWNEIFFKNLDEILENKYISSDSIEIIKDVIEIGLYHENPVIASSQISLSLIEIEKQLRIGNIPNRIKLEAINRMRIYSNESDIPLFFKKGSRSRTCGIPDYGESQQSLETHKKTLGNTHGNQGTNTNK